MHSRASWRVALITLVLLLPTALGGAPVKTRDTPERAGGQDILDAALDPTGQFYVAVVPVAAKTTGGIIPGTERLEDIYRCDFGNPSLDEAGAGCRGIRHGTDFGQTTLSANQDVALTSYVGGGGITTRFAIAGPSNEVSLWRHSSDTAIWARKVGEATDQLIAHNVTVTPDGSRVVAAASPSNVALASRLFVYDGQLEGTSAGALKWAFTFPNSRVNAMDAATSNLVAVATTTGIFFFSPHASTAPTVNQTRSVTTAGSATTLIMAKDGAALAAGTPSHVYYVPLGGDGPSGESFAYSLADGAQRVAISRDGQRFAAGSGSKVFFFQRINGTGIAAERGSFDVGARVVDMAYDATGGLLVVLAGKNVYGFAPGRSAPVWQFDATLPQNGGLDEPLRKIAVSDAGNRVLVAGKTKLIPYKAIASATAALGSGQTQTVQPAQPVVVPLRVKNTGSLADNYTFVVRRPVGWSGDNPEPVAMFPDEERTINISVTAPAGIQPGNFAMTVEVRSKVLQATVATAALNFTVPRAVSLLVVIEEERAFLQQGGEQTIPVTIRNQGNADGIVNLSADQDLSRGAAWRISFQPGRDIRVTAGGEATVDLVLEAPTDAGSGDKNTITVKATEGQIEAKKVLVAYVDARFGAELTAPNATLEFGPGEIRTLPVTIQNIGNTEDAFNMTTVLTPSSSANDWRVTLDREVVNVPRGASRIVTATIRSAVAEPREASLTVRADSQADVEREDHSLTVALVPRPELLEPEEDSLIPGVGVAATVALVALAAMGRRTRGGRP